MQTGVSELRTVLLICCGAFARPLGVLTKIRVYVWDTGTEPIADLRKMRFEAYFRPGSMLPCVPASGKILWHFVVSTATKRIARTSGNSQQAFEGAQSQTVQLQSSADCI